VAGATVVEDSDLDVVADQYLFASREENTDLAQLNVPGENLWPKLRQRNSASLSKQLVKNNSTNLRRPIL